MTESIKKLAIPLILAIISGGATAYVTFKVSMAENELRITQLENQIDKREQKIEQLNESIAKLTTSVEVNHALESAQMQSVDSRVERLFDTCCD